MATQTIPKAPNVPKPTMYDLSKDYARFGLSAGQKDEILGSKFTSRNGGTPSFIVLHIQDGTTPGSLSYWSSSAIDASSTVMVNKDGSVLRIIPEKDGPWTNGDVMGPSAEANEILALGGNPNNWSLTVEAEGHPDDAMPDVQRQAIVWQVEDWIIRYPRVLEHTWSILRHAFINSVTRSRCPGAYFQPVVDAVNAWLDTAGANVPPVVPPEPTPQPKPVPIYPEGMTEELARSLYGSVNVKWASKPFEFDPARSECQYWLARGKLPIKGGEDYTHGEWPELSKVIRRGNKSVHVYHWSNGDVYEKVIRKDPTP
jgi:hypothetical protein